MTKRDTGQDRAGSGLDAAAVEAELTRVWQRWERAVEELGGAVLVDQVRAVLTIELSGAMALNRLASALGISPSRASRLCQRMERAGLLAWEPNTDGRREIMLLVTDSGRRLAAWIHGSRRAVLAQGLDLMSPDGRQALARGLRELADALA